MFPTTSAVAIHRPIERFKRGFGGLDDARRRSAAGVATAMTNTPFSLVPVPAKIAESRSTGFRENADLCSANY
jgi:hypothetical protein